MGKDSNGAGSRALQWKAQVEAWQASGQTQTAFCKANRLKYANFSYWLRRFRAQHAAQPTEARQSPSSFVPVITTPLADGADGGLSARLPSGVELRGINEQNIDLVAQLVARLR